MFRKCILLLLAFTALQTISGDDTGTIASIIHMSESFAMKDNPKENVFTLYISIPEPQNVLVYTIRIHDSKKNAVSEREMKGFPKTVYTLDINSFTPGLYLATLDVRYKNGDTVLVESKPFKVVITPPQAVLSARKNIFTPDNDGIDDVMIITQETSEEREWKGIIEDGEGFIIETFVWTGHADREFRWDGIGKQGFVLKDGMYRYSLSAADEYGNIGKSNVIEFQLLTAKSALSLVSDYTAFSPNKDNIQDRISFTPKLQPDMPVKSFRFEIVDAAGKSVHSSEGVSVLPPSFSWDGKNSTGILMKDGSYKAGLTVIFLAGNRSTGKSQAFYLDTKAPELDLSVKSNLFSPNSDGRNDMLAINQSSPELLLWTGVVTNKKKAVIREWIWNGKLDNLVWDGLDGNGNTIPDGNYCYTVSAYDSAGNPIAKTIEPLILDTKPLNGTISPSVAAFSLSAKQNTVDFAITLDNTTDISSWIFVIRNQDGKSRKTFSGKGTIPKNIIWNGLNDQDKAVSGFYIASFTAVLSRGDIVSFTSDPVNLDLQGPVLDIRISPVVVALKKNYAQLEVSVSGDSEPVNISFSTRTGKLKKQDFTGIIPGDTRITLEYEADSDRIELPLPLVINVSASDTLGNTSSYSVKLVLDLFYTSTGNNLYISIKGMQNPSWKNYAVNPADFVQERIYQLISSTRVDLCLIELPDAWLVYSKKDITLSNSNSTATSRELMRYLTGKGFPIKNFRVISAADAARLLDTL